MGNNVNELILTQTIVLLPITFLSPDGRCSSNASKPCGHGPIDSGPDNECARDNETKRRAEALSPSKRQ